MNMNLHKKILSVFLSVLLVIGTFSNLCTFVSADEANDLKVWDSGMIGHYPLQNDAKDYSGKGNDGTISGTGTSFTGCYLNLPGGSYGTNNYVKLPAGMVDKQNTLTVSMWLKNDTGKGDYAAMFLGAAQNPPTGYWLLNPNKDGCYKSVMTNANTSTPWSNEVGVAGSTTTDNKWDLYTTVITPTTLTAYYNGKKIGSADHTRQISDFGSNLLVLIGADAYQDKLLQGSVRDVRIFNKELSSDDISDLYNNTKLSDQDIVDFDKDNLTIDNCDNITADLTLPTAGKNGSSISWKSNNNAIVIGTPGSSSVTGKVTRPKNEAGDAKVTLTANLSFNGVTSTKTIDVTVKALLSDAEIVQADQDALTLPNTNDVRGNITLPAAGSNGSTITWSSNNENVVNTTATASIPAGVVTRPKNGQSDANVTLTATIKHNTASLTKTFNLAVKAMPAAENDSDYLFCYFTGQNTANQEQIYLGTSQDGLHWTQVNGNNPVLTSTLGEKGVRDPCIIRSAEGDKFFIVATDLSIYNNGDWGRAQESGSHSIMIWESTDLVHWSNERKVDVAPDNAGCTWAPEAVYDPESGEYIVFWASKIPLSKGGDDVQRIYYCKTRDFYTFTKPQVYIETKDASGKAVSVIDTTILKNGNTYYRWSKSEVKTRITEEKSSSLLGTWTPVTSSSLENQSGVEGPTCFKFNNQNKWCLLLDNYGNSGYYPLTTEDLDKGVYTPLSSSDYALPGNPHPRHGTVIPIRQSEYDRIMKAYNNNVIIRQNAHGTVKADTTKVTNGANVTFTITPDSGYQLDTFTINGTAVAVPKSGNYTYTVTGNTDVTASATFKPYTEHKDPVLLYNFDEKQSGAVTDASGNNQSGTLQGNAKYVMDPTKKSQVLYLDGSDGGYLEFPKGFFDGRSTMTLSMDVKSELDSGNFFTAAFGQSDQKYMFLKTLPTSLKSVITNTTYTGEQGFTSNTANNKDKWVNLKVVFAPGTMSLYRDGVLVNRKSDLAVNVTDLGSDLLGYLGKSFYSGDSCFKGYFDNVKVYDRALSQAEIAKEFGMSVATVLDASADGYTFLHTYVDSANKKIKVYVKRGTDLTKIPINLDFTSDTATSFPANKTAVNLTKPVTYQVKANAASAAETWTVEAILCNNPVLNGLYADPQIAQFGNKYYIYPTSDGYPGWSGTKFKVFESNDLVNWKDDGAILDVTKDVSWATGSAWAPTITEKNGKYYFYFCANQKIGVAVADSPTGPFVAEQAPLITPTNVSDEGCTVGQTIDPSVFTDDDGKTYLLFGNGGSPLVVELNDDMVSYKPGTMQNITMSDGCDFRESFYVTKRNGVYHFTWSSDDTGSENYKVNYGTSDSIYGPITFQKTLLQKDSSKGILATGHQSILHVNGTDDYYIAYHRFAIPSPAGISGSDRGYNREVCLDKLTFDSEGYMNTVTPTLEGVGGSENTKTADKTALQTLYDLCAKFTQGDYTQASWSAFVSALNQAKAALDNEDAQQSDIDSAVTALTNAKNSLTQKSSSGGSGTSGNSGGSSRSGGTGDSTVASTPNSPASASKNADGSAMVEVNGTPDSNPTVSGKSSSFSVTIPSDVDKTAAAAATTQKHAKVDIKLPDDTIIGQLSSNAVQSVSMTLKVPSDVAYGTESNVDVSVNLDATVLQAAKTAKKDVSVTVLDTTTGKIAYTWTFKGADLAQSNAALKNINLAASTMTSTLDPSVPTSAKGVLVAFANNGVLPAAASVSIYVADQGFKPNQAAFVYYYNSNTHQFETIDHSDTVVDVNGYVHFVISHCSKYVVLPNKVAAVAPVQLDTGSSLKVKAGKTYCFKVTSSQKPTLVSGNGSIFKAISSIAKGNSYYFTFKAVGKARQSAGFYLNGAKLPNTIGTIG